MADKDTPEWGAADAPHFGVSGGGTNPPGRSGLVPPRPVRASAKTVLVASARFLGPGVVELLEAVDASGSVKRACEQMGLSYTKGWRLIHTLEAELGTTCVARQQGGVGGGRASLTPECRALLERFAALTADVDAAVNDLFVRRFPDLAGQDGSSTALSAPD